MNTANLQLEGLYLAIAALHETLIEKGVVSRGEVDAALRAAEHAAFNDGRSGDLRPAEREALAFPARVLRTANATVAQGIPASFSDLARRVGAAKERLGEPN